MSAKKKNKRKPPKIMLEKKKVFILTSTITILCILLLFINAFFGKEQKPEPPQRTEQKAEQKAQLKPPAEDRQKKDTQTQKQDREETTVKSDAGKARQTKPSYDIPQAQEGSTIVFIIDDGGHNLEKLKRYTALPFPITVAVLPGVAETKECAAQVVQDGKELMLHQPMQAENLSVNPGPCAITPDMSLGEIKDLIRKNLSELGSGVKGLNNHEGSLITEDEVRIGAVLDAVQECGVYFIDSRTTAETKAEYAAAIRGMTIRHRDIFIDNIIDKKEMAAQICHGLALANKNGTAIMIGHVDKSADVLPDLLLDMYPHIIQKGYRIAVPSMLQ